MQYRKHTSTEQKVEERTKELRKLTENLQNEVGERNRIMEALAISEEKYRSLVEQIGDIVFHIDEEGYITYLSPHILTDIGMTPEHFQKNLCPRSGTSGIS